jgi:hypothetical protein
MNSIGLATLSPVFSLFFLEINMKYFYSVFFSLLTSFLMPAAQAAVDLSAITTVFNLSDFLPQVLAVGIVLATLYVALRAARTALSWIRGGDYEPLKPYDHESFEEYERRDQQFQREIRR